MNTTQQANVEITTEIVKDKCVLCNADTLFDNTHHVDMRYCYVEGMGQLCFSCYNMKDNVINIPVALVEATSNNAKLGEKVRSIYYESK